MTTKITEKNISSLANAGVNWQAVVVADGSTGTTGVAGRGYFIDTTSAAHTFTLPATATFADTILIKDYAGTFATNALTIARNGHKIQGVENNSLINTNRASVTLVYVDVTRGWEFVTESNVADLQEALFITATGGTVTTSGNFKIHSFTGDGCFVVATAGNPFGSDKVDYLVVAGGGGASGSPCNSIGTGGAGAGGYRTTFPSPGCNAGSFPITATTFPITVGSGGGGGAPGTGNNGNNSIFSTITSTGGGRSGVASSGVVGQTGGSGGGGSGGDAGPRAGGAGNTPPTSPSQGNPGGNGVGPGAYAAGGGGGAGAPGGNATAPGNNPPFGQGGNGGNGSANSISGSPVTYAGGGGGGSDDTPGGTGGTGGGGNGGFDANNGNSGTVNTGGGGGGTWYQGNRTGGSGGKGIVVIRYKFQ